MLSLLDSAAIILALVAILLRHLEHVQWANLTAGLSYLATIAGRCVANRRAARLPHQSP